MRSKQVYGVFTLPDTDSDTGAIGLQTHLVGVGIGVSIGVGQCEHTTTPNTDSHLTFTFASVFQAHIKSSSHKRKRWVRTLPVVAIDSVLKNPKRRRYL